MDETPFPLNQDELTEEDLAILRAFDAMEDRVVERTAPTQPAPTVLAAQLPDAQLLDPDASDMFVLFCTEADEDIGTMRNALRQLEPPGAPQDEPFHYDPARFVVLGHAAHKLKGTAAAMGLMTMSTIARHIERIIELIQQHSIDPLTGFHALVQAVNALEVSLQQFVEEEQESSLALEQLEAEYRVLGIAPQMLTGHKAGEGAFAHTGSAGEVDEAASLLRVDTHRFAQLARHSEQLAQLSIPIELAQEQVESALQELNAAQGRLRYLETLFSITPLSATSAANRQDGAAGDGELPSSSLIARILEKGAARGHVRKSRVRPHFTRQDDAWAWDELEIDRYTESDILAQLLSEAIADVSTASAQVHAAFAQLNRLVQQQSIQVAHVRTDVLSLPHLAGFQRTMRVLLVRVGDQRIGVPFEQVWRADFAPQPQQEDSHYTLHALLGFPVEKPPAGETRPTLLLNTSAQAVEVDEVVGEIELVVKPLAPPLQRPGIIGAAVDGLDNVLLIVDISVLMQQYTLHEHRQPPAVAEDGRHYMPREQNSPTVLIADDSVYIRKSLRYMLSHAGYTVREARDGTEALQSLTEHLPAFLLLDIEMPNLDGYELLSIIRSEVHLASMKVVMLTSRSSEKYQQRAFELGAHAYLTKPCPQETLLNTLQSLPAS